MKYIIGNWKMNKLPNEAINFVEKYTALVNGAKEVEDRKLILCVPFIDLFYTNLYVQESDVKVGAQNMFYEKSGAYTGEISGEMLASLGLEYVIIGHSERREIFKETDEQINLKVKKAYELGMKPIICVGENSSDNEKGITKIVIENQVKKAIIELRKSK